MRYRSNLLECPRCAHQYLERRSGWFRDADYHELLQEYLELERRARRAEARLKWEQDETAWWKKEAAWTMEHLTTVMGILLREATTA